MSQALTARPFPLTRPVLEQVKGLSGAELLFVHPNGTRISTFAAGPVEVPPDERVDGVPDDQIGPPVSAVGTEYRCRRPAVTAPHPLGAGRVHRCDPES